MEDYRIALALGFRSPYRMMWGLTANEYMGWRKYFAMEPTPTFQLDLHLARITAMIEGYYGRRGDISDYILRYQDARAAKQSEETMQGIMKDAASYFNNKLAKDTTNVST